MPVRTDGRAVVAALSLLVACTGSSAGPSAPGADAGQAGTSAEVSALCSKVSTYSQRCGASRCVEEQVMYCTTWAPSFSSSFQAALEDCVAPTEACLDGGVLAPTLDCFRPHLATPTPAQAKVKADFCAQCPDGTSSFRPTGCTDFFSLGVDDAGNSEGVGGVALILNDDLVGRIDATCTGPNAQDSGISDCAKAFQNCAAGALLFDANLPAACTDVSVSVSP